MARINLAEAQKEQIVDAGLSPDIYESISDLKYIKTQLKDLKKKEDKLVAIVKDYMIKNDLTNISSISIEANLSERKTISFKTEELIEWAKDNGYDDIVKTIEVVDEVELEKQVYNGFISPKDLEPFQVEKVSKVLTIK